MEKWCSTWGYANLDFSAFPLAADNDVQLFSFCNLISGSAFRIRFQNQFQKVPVRIKTARLWMQKEDKHIELAISCNQQEVFDIPGKSGLWSDPLEAEFTAGEWLTVYLAFEDHTQAFCGCTFLENSMMRVEHYDRTERQKKEISDLSKAFASLEPDHQIVMGFDQIQIQTEEKISVVAVFGDSITHMSRWSAPLAEKMLQENVGKMVLINKGIGGNRLLHDSPPGSDHGNWFGKKGTQRFESQLFYDDFHADHIILLEGINDILQPLYGVAPKKETVTAQEITDGLEYCAHVAHQHNACIYIATLLPFNGFLSYWSQELEEMRGLINQWIRNSRVFDGILDFDLWLRDSNNPTKLDKKGGSQDNLHPGVIGGKMIADQIEVSCFRPEVKNVYNIRNL